MKRMWALLFGLAMLGTSCLDGVAMSPEFLSIDFDHLETYEAGCGPADPRFELTFSETDAIGLGLSETTFALRSDTTVIALETKYRHLPVEGYAIGPGQADDVVVVNQDTGGAFVAIEAGYCLE